MTMSLESAWSCRSSARFEPSSLGETLLVDTLSSASALERATPCLGPRPTVEQVGAMEITDPAVKTAMD